MEQVEPQCESLLSQHNRRLAQGAGDGSVANQVVDFTVSATPPLPWLHQFDAYSPCCTVTLAFLSRHAVSLSVCSDCCMACQRRLAWAYCRSCGCMVFVCSSIVLSHVLVGKWDGIVNVSCVLACIDDQNDLISVFTATGCVDPQFAAVL